MLGHYSFTLADNVLKGGLRPLNQLAGIDNNLGTF